MSEVAIKSTEFRTAPKPLSDQDLVSLVQGEFESAMGREGGEIAKERANLWDLYLSKPLGDEEEGRSQIVTSDVSDVVDGMLPSLARIFTTAENLADFEPFGSLDPEANARDEIQAQQESDYVNYVFWKQNPAFEILITWFMDALIQKNGIVKAWWNEARKITRETYKGLNEGEYLTLLQDDELEVVEETVRPEKSMTPGVVEESQPVEIKVHDVTFRRVAKKGQVSVEPVPPEEYRISSDSRSVDPNKARFVGHERNVKRSELIEMGFDPEKVEALPENDQNLDTPESQAREDTTDERDTGAAHDRSQDDIFVREGYLKIDTTGDGISELHQIVIANNVLLSKEIVDRQPFHVITPQILPHKHFGRASAEKVDDIQVINSTLVRQTHDNLYHTNNPGHAVWEQGVGENTLDDLMTTRVGRIARFRRPVSESYSPLTVPFTAKESFGMMAYWDKIKKERTGIGGDGEGLTPEALKNIQQSVLMQAVDLSKMKIELVVRMFAETGIRSLFMHIHELLQKHQDKEQIVMLRDQWVPVNPQEWRTRENMTINIGLGIGTREQNLLHLEAIWDKQTQMRAGGGMNVTVTPKNFYNTAAEIVNNANMKSPEKYFKDPGAQQFPTEGDMQGQLAQAQATIAQQQQMLQLREQNIERENNILDYQSAVQKNILQFQAEMAKNGVNQEKVNNELFVQLEKLSNQLTEVAAKQASDIAKQ